MVNQDKRQRHKEGHRSRMEEARIAEAKRRRTRSLTTAGVAVLAVLAVFAAVTLLGGDDEDTVTTASSTTVDPTATPGTIALPPPVEGEAVTGNTPCPAGDGSSPRTTSFEKAPPVCIQEGKTYTALLETSEGDITIALDAEQSPITVNNFVVLARYHYFDGLPFHRIVPGFVNQGGSSGDPDYGSGGPGYDLIEEAPTAEYEVGTVSMARAENVSGSQFFITVDPAPLAGSIYPIVGKVTEGMDVVMATNEFGDAESNGTPTKLVTIDKVTITVS